MKWIPPRTPRLKAILIRARQLDKSCDSKSFVSLRTRVQIKILYEILFQHSLVAE